MDRFHKSIYAALYAAMIFVACFFIKIPVPGMGYIHPGDGLVLLAGIFLGPMWGGLAAGFGSALCDMLAGYDIYIPATFFIKWGCAAIAYLLTRRLSESKLGLIMSGVVAEIFMTAMYFGYELFLYHAGAFAGIPYNLVQGAMGVIVCAVLYPAVRRIFKVVVE